MLPIRYSLKMDGIVSSYNQIFLDRMDQFSGFDFFSLTSFSCVDDNNIH